MNPNVTATASRASSRLAFWLTFALATGATAIGQVNPADPSPATEGPAVPAAEAVETNELEPEPLTGQPLLPPATMTSRAVYSDQTEIVADASSIWSPPTHDGQVFRTGQITVRPGLSYLYLYGDGVLSRPGVEAKTSMHSFAPSVTVGVGDVWRFAYVPVWRIYSSDRFNDSINHRAHLRGETRYQAWRLAASQGYTHTRSPLAETGAQTRVERFLTRLEAGYDLNSRSRLEGDFTQSLRNSESASDFAEWSSSLWFIHNLQPGITAGVGVAGGYVDLEDMSNMSFGRVLGRVSLQTSQKVTWALRGGYERRSYLDSDAPTIDEPIMGASVVYRPLDTTMVSLDYDRSIGNSLFQNRVTETDTFGIELRQRLLQRFALSVSYTMRQVDYVVNVDNPLGREDEINSFNVSLGTQLHRRISGALLYRQTENDTNRSEFAYDSEQMGVELRYSF